MDPDDGVAVGERLLRSDGIAGLQGSYAAPGRGGRYAVFVVDGLTIEVTISGADLDLGRTLPRIEASTRSLRHDEATR